MDFELNLESREVNGSRAAARVRGAGNVPAIIYSHGVPSVPVMLSDREFGRLARLAGVSQVFKLNDKTGKLTGRSVIVKDIQQDHVKGRVMHVDLQLLRDDEEITLEVRLQFVGEAPGVKTDGGIFTAAAHALSVTCLPKHIPQLLSVDISSLNLGESIHARDVKLPEGVALATDPDVTVASVVAQRAMEEAAPAAAATPAEGEAAAAPAAGAEGGAANAPAAAAPAADGAKAKGAEAKGKK